MKTKRPGRPGGAPLLVISIILTVAALGAAAVWIGSGAAGDDMRQRDEFVVQRGSFEITVPASGELAAIEQIEIRNKLDYRAVITEIVPEGTFVNEGDVLVKLATDEVENKIKDAKDDVDTAQSALVAAQSNLDIKESERQSALDEADLAVMLAKLSLEGWKEGEVKAKRQSLALELDTAEMDYQRLLHKYEESKKLKEQEFISEDEFKMDEIRMIEAKARLEQAKLDKLVYEEYEYKKQEAQKQSDVEQAEAERQRVEERYKASLETARADVTSKQRRLRSHKERLAELQEQLEHCIVEAPSGGLVVYATSLEDHRWHRRNEGDLQAGAELRKNELVMVLPDTSEMAAEVKVNESLTGLIEPGQRAVVTSDAVPDQTLSGEVASIGVLAESGGWRDPNRRDYTVKIRLLDGNGLGLKPSMRCKAEVYVGEVTDSLFVPLQAVYREGASAYVYVPQEAGFAQHRVETGESSGLYVEVTDGLDEGDVVLLREPAAREIVARLDDREQPEPARNRTAAIGGPVGTPKG